jgi:hypothetical protein
MTYYHAGINLVEIASRVIGMVIQIVIPRMVMARTEAMIGMVAHEVVAIGMEVEGQHGMKEEVTGTSRVLMTALIGQDAHLPLTTTKYL